MKEKLQSVNNLVPAALLALFFCGCQSVIKYPPYKWSNDVQTLGPVKANSGFWPLSLHIPPPEYTYQSALIGAASKNYGIPKDRVALGEIEVKIGSEIDGTIRDWTATSIAGQIPDSHLPAVK